MHSVTYTNSNTTFKSTLTYGNSAEKVRKDYVFGFNGQEKDDEVAGSGNINTAMFWEYDTRLGRRWNTDPKPIPSISYYATFANNPIWFSDILGDSSVINDKGKLLFKDKNDLRVFLKQGDKLEYLGKIGEKINVNKVVPNILKENKEKAKELGLWGFKKKVQTGGDWDYKNAQETIFGLAWEIDKSSGKTEEKYTKFQWGVYSGNSADFGNFHAGYTGRYTYGGKGMPRIILYYGAGFAETTKDIGEGHYYDAAKQVIQMTGMWGASSKPGFPIIFLPPSPPFGDELDDFIWNTKGMNFADYEKTQKK